MERNKFLQRIYPYLLILPGLSVYAFFLLLPLAQNYIFSFLSWQFGSYRGFIGLENYINLIRDPIFVTAFTHNLLWMFLLLIFSGTMGLILASILAGDVKGRVVFSTIYFIPCTVALVVAATIWAWMYNPIIGPLNVILEKMGLGGVTRAWLADRKVAIYALNVVGNWTHLGFCVVIFLSSLQSVNPNLYEAARIDGASSFQRFWYITIPSIKSTIIFVALYSCVISLKIFGIVWTATRGAPAHATEVIETYMFFLFFRADEISYASTGVAILTTIALILSMIVIYSYARQRKGKNL